MATTYHAAIQELYVAYFNRPADVAGLNHWEMVLEGNNGDLSVVAAEFAKSPEYTSLFTGKTNAEIVAQIYINLFGRTGDEVGMKFWVDALVAGNMTVAQAVDFIANGAQGTDAEIVENKVIAATAFTTALDTEAEQAGYAGTDALTLAKAFIAGVTSDATLAAATTPAAISATVTAVVKAGTPFTLAGALASLNASLEAKSDFLAETAEVDAIDALLGTNPTDAQIEAAIATNLAAGAVDIDALIAGYSADSATLRAAKVSVLETELTEALAAAEVELAADVKAINAVVGLSAAIDATEAADAAEEEATTAAALAENAETAALANAKTLTGNATIAYAAAGAGLADDTVTATVGGVAGTVLIKYDVDAEAFVLNTGATEVKYPGITAYLDAINASVAADAALVEASAAADLAFKGADFADSADDGTLLKAVAAKMVFSTAATKDRPTAVEIANEAAMHADKIDALDALVVANGDGASYAAVLTSLGTAFDGAASASALATLTAAAVADGYITAADKAKIDAGYTAGVDTAESTLLNANNFQARATAFGTAVTNLETAETAETGIGDLYDAAYADVTGTAVLVGDAEDDIEALQDALAAFEEAAELDAGVDAANAAIAAANKTFVDNKFAAPVVLDGGLKLSTASDDLFIAGSADTEVRSAGILGTDRIYVGTTNTYNATILGAGTGETDLEDAGNVAALEFFMEETATGVKVYIETEAYGSETGDFVTINLVGVDLTDVTVANGFLTIA